MKSQRKLKADKQKAIHKVKLVAATYTLMPSSKLAFPITDRDPKVTVFAQQCQLIDQCWSKTQAEHQE